MKKLHLNWLRGGGALRRVGLVLVLCLIAVGQMWGKYIYLNTADLTGWEGSSAKFKLYPGTGSDVDGVKVYDHMYRFDVPKATGTMWFKRYSSDGNTLWNQFEVTYNASYNVYKVTSWSKTGCSDKCSSGTYDSSTTIKEIYLDVHTNWYKDGPLFKLTTGGKTYTTTGYVGTNLVIFSVPSPSGNLFFERWKSDNSTRWNTAETTYNSSYNAYEITDWGAVSASYNVKIVDKPNYFYLDNSQTAWTQTYQYLLIGHDKPKANTQVYRLSTSDITNTKLRYYSNTTLTFRDAGYISFIGSGSAWSSGDWGTTTADDATKYTAPYTSTGDYSWDKVYLFVPASGTNNASLTKNEYSNSSGMNNTQTLKYALSTDGGSSYSAQSSGTTKGTISIASYKFVDGTYNSVSASSSPAKSISAGGTTYSTTETAAYTATTTLTESSTATGYTFAGWYIGSTLHEDNPYTFNPKTATTIEARFKANSYTVAYNKNDSYYTGTATGSTSSSTHYYDVEKNLTSNGFSLTGYTFAGWGTAAGTGAVTYTNGQSVTNLSSTQGATVNLYARWSEIKHSVTVAKNIDAGGTISTTSVSDIGIATASGTITATANPGYYFTGWTIPSGVTLASGTASSPSITINATADSKTITANFALRWTVTGNTSALGSWATPGDLVLGNISTSAGVTTGYVDVSLAAHTAYEIKMWDKAAGEVKYVGYEDEENEINYSNSGTSYTLNTYPGYNFKFLSAGAGTYRITRDMTNNKVIITYPDAYKVTYYENGADNDDVPEDNVYYGSGETVTVKGNTGSLSKDGYDALAYWTTAPGGGTDYAIGTGQFSISANTPLYAKWTQTVELDANGGSADGSLTAIYNAAGPFTPSAPTYADHTVDGYQASDGTAVLTAAGAFAATSVSDGSSVAYISGSKWVKAGATTLYAHWKVNAPGISCTDNVVTMTVPTGATVYYTTNGSTPTSSSTAYDPSNKPTIAANTTFNAITIQSGCTNSDVTTYAATYTPVYTVDFTLTNASKSTGETSVLENKSYTATFSEVTGYDLPTTVTVTIGGVTKTVTTDYTWNQGTGTLTILANKINGNVVITVNGVAETYTISYKDQGNEDYSGSNLASLPTSHTYGSATALVNGVKSGYRFEGWYTDDECTVSAGSSIGATAITANTTYYAKWAQLYTITNGNPSNGTITVVSSAAEGDEVSISASGSTGYNFSSWSIYKTGDQSTTVSPAASSATTTFTMPAYAVTVDASFAAKTYTATGNIDKNGGSTAGQYTATYGSNKITINTEPVYSGYEVEEYHFTSDLNMKIASADGTLVSAFAYDAVTYISGGKWAYDGYITLYPKWVPKTYTINLDANLGGISGTSGSASFKVTIGDNNYDFDPDTEGEQDLTQPSKEGYTFAGYYTATDGDTQVIGANGSTVGGVSGYTKANGNWDCSDDDLTLYAHWTDNHIYYYNGATADGWSTASNWTKGAVPASDGSNTIHILKPLVISSDKKVAAVDIITSGTYTPTGGSAIDASGKLTINPNVGLNVTGTVTRTADATSNLATHEGDLVLESSSAGNASLIFDNSYSCQATVQMYSKASISGSTWNWQYVGTPFTGSIPLYNYYGSWMYKWNNGGWDVVKGSDELTPFAGYCLTQESATTHVMGGTLVPTTSKSVTMSASTDMVLANSWTAPIYIGGFTESTFTSTPATIYLFNTGSAENGSSAGSEAGTYVAIPIFTTPYVGGGLIAPMQGFFVTTNGGSAGTITMNYADLVRPADSRSIVAGPMYAPKRAEEGDEPVLQDQPEEAPTVLKIWANGSVYNDRLVILAREDFSEGFDNGWDGSKMSFGVASPSVYVINAQGGYDAVSAIPNLEGTVIGFRAGEDKVCTMTFDYNGEEIWYLNDLQEQRSTEINSEINYQFTTSAGDSEVRFIVSKTPINHMPTGIEEISDQNSVVRKQMIDGILYIIRDGRIYSAQGALVK